MKILKLLISERLGIRNLLNETYQKGGLTLDSLTDAQNIMTKIAVNVEFNEKPDKDGFYKAIKDTEAVKIKMRQGYLFSQGVKTPQLIWDPRADKGKDIEFSNDEIILIKELIESKNSQKGFKLGDDYMVELARKVEFQSRRENNYSFKISENVST